MEDGEWLVDRRKITVEMFAESAELAADVNQELVRRNRAARTRQRAPTTDIISMLDQLSQHPPAGPESFMSILGIPPPFLPPQASLQ